MGIFSGIKEQQASVDRNPWFDREGTYWAEIQRAHVFPTRKSGEGLFVELKILKVVDDPYEPQSKQDEDYDPQQAALRPGDEVTHALMCSRDNFLKEAKAFNGAATGLRGEEIDEHAAMMVVGEDQPLRGTVIETKGKNILTKKGQPFTVVTYKREVEPEELREGLTDAQIKRFYPDGLLDRMVELAQADEA